MLAGALGDLKGGSEVVEVRVSHEINDIVSARLHDYEWAGT